MYTKWLVALLLRKINFDDEYMKIKGDEWNETEIEEEQTENIRNIVVA